MAKPKKIPLSGSTHGRGVKVAATSTPGTTIHTAAAVTTDGEGDDVVIYGRNDNTTVETLTIEWGGTTDPDDTIEFVLAAGAPFQLLIPGGFIRNALVIKAFSTVANKVVLWGYAIVTS